MLTRMFSLRQTWRYRRAERNWQRKWDALAPKKGEPAPDFELWDVEGKVSVRLSDFRGKKPVALIFGSFT